MTDFDADVQKNPFIFMKNFLFEKTKSVQYNEPTCQLLHSLYSPRMVDFKNRILHFNE